MTLSTYESSIQGRTEDFKQLQSKQLELLQTAMAASMRSARERAAAAWRARPDPAERQSARPRRTLPLTCPSHSESRPSPQPSVIGRPNARSSESPRLTHACAAQRCPRPSHGEQSRAPAAPALPFGCLYSFSRPARRSHHGSNRGGSYLGPTNGRLLGPVESHQHAALTERRGRDLSAAQGSRRCKRLAQPPAPPHSEVWAAIPFLLSLWFFHAESPFR